MDLQVGEQGGEGWCHVPPGPALIWVLAESLWQETFEGSWVMRGPLPNPQLPTGRGAPAVEESGRLVSHSVFHLEGEKQALRWL